MVSVCVCVCVSRYVCVRFSLCACLHFYNKNVNSPPNSNTFQPSFLRCFHSKCCLCHKHTHTHKQTFCINHQPSVDGNGVCVCLFVIWITPFSWGGLNGWHADRPTLMDRHLNVAGWLDGWHSGHYSFISPFSSPTEKMPKTMSDTKDASRENIGTVWKK